MKVLFVSSAFPKDLRIHVHGVFQRMRLFIEAIGGMADLDMLFYVAPNIDLSPDAVVALERCLSNYWNVQLHLVLCPRLQSDEKRSKWHRYAAPALNFFHHSGHAETSGPWQVKALEACLSRRPDAIVALRLGSMCPLLLTRQPLPPVFFDLDDIEHVALVRGIHENWTWRDKLIHYSRLPSLCWGERQALRLAHRAFVCSEPDRDYLEHRWGFRNVVTIPNGVEVSKPLPVTQLPTLMFLGSYWHGPNIQAAEYLLGEIWPRIVKAMPEARLLIAGACPEKIIDHANARPHVQVTGFVDDLEELYRRSRVVCAPILSGAGTRIKIIEAAAYGKPIVATRLGAEGLLLRDQTELLIGDDPDSFAHACLMVLKDSALCERLGHAAHAAVREHYSRDKVVRLIQSYLRNGQPSPQAHDPAAAAVKV